MQRSKIKILFLLLCFSFFPISYAEFSFGQDSYSDQGEEAQKKERKKMKKKKKKKKGKKTKKRKKKKMSSSKNGRDSEYLNASPTSTVDAYAPGSGRTESLSVFSGLQMGTQSIKVAVKDFPDFNTDTKSDLLQTGAEGEMLLGKSIRATVNASYSSDTSTQEDLTTTKTTMGFSGGGAYDLPLGAMLLSVHGGAGMVSYSEAYNVNDVNAEGALSQFTFRVGAVASFKSFQVGGSYSSSSFAETEIDTGEVDPVVVSNNISSEMIAFGKYKLAEGILAGGFINFSSPAEEPDAEEGDPTQESTILVGGSFEGKFSGIIAESIFGMSSSDSTSLTMMNLYSGYDAGKWNAGILFTYGSGTSETEQVNIEVGLMRYGAAFNLHL